MCIFLMCDGCTGGSVYFLSAVATQGVVCVCLELQLHVLLCDSSPHLMPACRVLGVSFS